MKNRKTTKKVVKAVIIAMCCIALTTVAAVAVFCAYLRVSLADYYSNSEKVFKIPGSNDGFIAQGLCHDETTDTFFVCGYFGNANPSAVYAIQGDSAKVLWLKKENGDDFFGHCGGISCHGDYLYVAGSGKGCLFVLRLDDVLNAKNGDHIEFCGKINTDLGDNDDFRVSFTGSSDTHIYVGEYYSKNLYKTPESHHFTHNGVEFGSVILEYAYSPDSPFGVDPEPTKMISTIDGVQGMCFDKDGDIFLSVSASFSISKILKYDHTKLYRADDVPIRDKNVAHYLMTDSAREYSVKIPPMSEEIIFVGDRLYSVNEFASNRFLIGKLMGADYCQAFDPQEIAYSFGK